jgi:CBS domain-containing protein
VGLVTITRTVRRIPHIVTTVDRIVVGMKKGSFSLLPHPKLISGHHHQPHHGGRSHPHQDLLTLTIDTIVQNKGNLIEVPANESLQSVLGLLHQHKISSLPVYEDLTSNMHHSPSQRVYKGIVSVVDVLVYLHRYQSVGNETPEEILQQPIRKAIGSTKESSNILLEEDRTLLSSLIDKMCQGLSPPPSPPNEAPPHPTLLH